MPDYLSSPRQLQRRPWPKKVRPFRIGAHVKFKRQLYMVEARERIARAWFYHIRRKWDGKMYPHRVVWYYLSRA